MSNILRFAFVIILILTAMSGVAEDARGVDSKIKQLDQYAAVGKQHAVFIAIDKYKNWIPLKNPVKDVTEIKDILTENYYIDTVHELINENATKGNILKLFEQLQKTLKVNDSLFIFYAGHGHLDAKTNTGFWIPVNAGVDDYEQENWLPNGQLRGLISNIKASHICLVSDSCFSGDILNPMRAKMPAINNDYFKKAYKLISRQVLTSGASQTVPDSSEFSMLLKMVLRKNNQPYIDPMMLFDEIRLGMKQTTPMFGDLRETGHQDGGSFLFFRKNTGDSKKTASIKEKSEINITEESLYGSIKIQIKEKGKLYVDGVFIKDVVPEKSVKLGNILAGSHEIKIVYEGFVETKTLFIEEDKETLVHFEYRPTKTEKTESSVSSTKERPEQSADKDEFTENFDGPALGGNWQWVREHSTMWSLKERPGSLAIHTEYGDLSSYPNSTIPNRKNKNMLLTESKYEDFQLDAKLEFNPVNYFHQAGIVVFRDDAHFVANIFGISLGETETRKRGVKLVVREKFHLPSIPIKYSILFLRLIKNGNEYTGYCSIDGTNYTLVNKIVADLGKNPKIGLVAYGGQEDYSQWNPNNIAFFDYFRVSKKERTATDTSQQSAAELASSKLPADLFDYLTEIQGHHYFISKNVATWMDAVELCKKYGGHLATLTTFNENSSIEEAMKKKDMKKTVWIGLAYEGGLWKWVTGEKSSSTNWNVGNPGCCIPEINRFVFYTGTTFGWSIGSETTTNLFMVEVE